ncbi:MAG: NADH-quinone oxidoreductase subunit B family protein [Candidatus Thermoplasmatota archaeon]|nr:NADH-quinone oxidoreductase subunit B family protein [Candidatus Thermoplasmatota archaeon]
MSSIWFLNGVRKGIKTERFPSTDPDAAPQWPSRLSGNNGSNCPIEAITPEGWIMEKCIFCRRCLPDYQPTGDQDIFTVKKSEKTFRKSFHVFPLDSGACGSCNMEFLSIFSPQYDANRLGIFMVNTPRHADAIVIMGVMTPGMKEALDRAYEAMPEPRLVIALGACAVTGGIVGDAPLDRERYHVEIAGCPPSPYTVLAALNAARGGSNSRTDSGSGSMGVH